MLVVEDLLRGIDAQGYGEFNGLAGDRFGEDVDDLPIGELRVEHSLKLARLVADAEDLFAGEAERFGALAGHELKRQDAHADQVGAVDALVALGDDEFYAEQARAFGGPVARAA